MVIICIAASWSNAAYANERLAVANRVHWLARPLMSDCSFFVLAYYPRMPPNLSPVHAEDLLQVLAYALTLVQPRQGKETPDQSDLRRQLGAKAIAEYLKLAGVRCYRGPAAPLTTGRPS